MNGVKNGLKVPILGVKVPFLGVNENFLCVFRGEKFILWGEI